MASVLTWADAYNTYNIQAHTYDTYNTYTCIHIHYIDKETLLIRESVYMNEYNSIETGYNMKHSVDLQNLY